MSIVGLLALSCSCDDYAPRPDIDNQELTSEIILNSEMDALEAGLADIVISTVETQEEFENVRIAAPVNNLPDCVTITANF